MVSEVEAMTEETMDFNEGTLPVDHQALVVRKTAQGGGR